MDAKILGAFIAECRREKNMTQADLAAKLNVTDKAVSRWERGLGFPDIGTIEPLASALDISILELMKSERITDNEVAKETATNVISDTLNIAELQCRQERKQERRNVFSLLGITFVIVIIVLFLDRIKWQPDILLFESIGVVLPLFCICGFFILLCSGIWKKATGRPCTQTFAAASVLRFIFLILLGLFFLIGILGIGPVPGSTR